MGVQCFCLNNQLPIEFFTIQQKFLSRPKIFSESEWFHFTTKKFKREKKDWENFTLDDA